MADKTNGTQVTKATGAMSKKDAVRRALQDLGKEAKPLQIREHVKKRYHIDMGLDHISTVKGEILREGGQAEPAAQKPASTPSAAAKPPTYQPATTKQIIHKVAPEKAGKTPSQGAQGISLQDIEAIKDLLERVGATHLKTLIDVMAR